MEDSLVYFDKPFGNKRIPGRVLSVLYSQWLPGWSKFSLNFTLIRCVHFSIEMIRPLFRVKWRLFSQTTQHVLVVSNSLEAIMILIALSDSWHRLLHFQCSDWVTQFTKVLLAEFFFSLLRLVPRNKNKKKLVQKVVHNFIASVVDDLKLQGDWMLV